MKYYKDDNDKVYAYDLDGSQDNFIPDYQTPITEAEADALRKPVITAFDVWERIKAERDQRKDGGFKVEIEPGIYKWFHSDVFSRTQHIGLENKARVLLASGGALSDIIQISINGQIVDARWKTMDGTKVFITARTALDIIAAAEAMDASLFYAGEQHETAMKASPDPATYDYSIGWPERFGDELS